MQITKEKLALIICRTAAIVTDLMAIVRDPKNVGAECKVAEQALTQAVVQLRTAYEALDGEDGC